MPLFSNTPNLTDTRDSLKTRSAAPIPSRKPEPPEDQSEPATEKAPLPPKKPEQKKSSPTCSLEYTNWQKALKKVKDLEEQQKKLKKEIQETRQAIEDEGNSVKVALGIGMGKRWVGVTPATGTKVPEEIIRKAGEKVLDMALDSTSEKPTSQRSGEYRRLANKFEYLGQNFAMNNVELEKLRRDVEVQKRNYNDCKNGNNN